MKKKEIYSDFYLVLVAVIWGLSFSFQKQAADLLPALQFNAARFFAASIAILAICLFTKERSEILNIKYIRSGAGLGLILFSANWLQQVGIGFTSVANSGFITSMYVIIIPIYLFASRKKPKKSNWIAAIMSLVGIYLLTGADIKQINIGDIIQLVGAFLWAAHIMYLSYWRSLKSVIALGFWQTFFCASFSSTAVFGLGQEVVPELLLGEWKIICFTGIISMGLALIMQTYAQQHTKPSHASIILSLEGLFAALFAWLILGESMTITAMLGGFIIMISIFYSQFRGVDNRFAH